MPCELVLACVSLTLAGYPSTPAAFHDLTANIPCSSPSIVSGDDTTDPLPRAIILDRVGERG